MWVLIVIAGLTQGRVVIILPKDLQGQHYRMEISEGNKRVRECLEGILLRMAMNNLASRHIESLSLSRQINRCGDERTWTLSNLI